MDRPGDWHMIRNVEGIFLTRLEQEDLSWDSTEEISKLKNCYIYNAQRSSDRSNSHNSKQDENVVPCPLYQRGNCPREGPHSGFHHVCAKCWREKSRAHRHPESSCYTAAGAQSKKGNF